MTEAPRNPLPILIGVTGKRQFAGDLARNRHLLNVFAVRFGTLIARLDEICPDIPKALLCGGAAGTDLAAARVTLDRPRWSIVLALPLERELFEQDFQEQPFADDLPYFRHLCDCHPRVTVRTLQRLRIDPFKDRKSENLEILRVGYDRLIKQSGIENVARSQHFEQLGLWLARTATLLVAATPGEAAKEKPFRLGGSARVVAYRRTATPDSDAAEVINRSSELCSNSAFEEPDGGHVLWIDPTRDSLSTAQFDLPGVEALSPMRRSIDNDYTSDVDSVYANPMQNPLDRNGRSGEADTSRHRERGALAVAYAFQRMYAGHHG